MLLAARVIRLVWRTSEHAANSSGDDQVGRASEHAANSSGDAAGRERGLSMLLTAWVMSQVGEGSEHVVKHLFVIFCWS